ncbi:MAG: NAD-dependent DNA ligase LigA [Candidatus Lokiarchaeota archaeon]|nr:NAD-dependent DNA ligase LigA [Candidatus Lokiarchaeota archaeon]
MSDNNEFNIPENKQEAKQRIQDLREEIRYHDKKYFVENQPVISDAEYDDLVRELEALEEAYPEFITEDSPSQRVGAGEIDEFQTVEHKSVMLSLDKAFNYEELKDFDDRVKRNWKQTEVEYVVETKIDGLGVALLYEDKSLKRGATRGDGARGDDITPNIRTIHAIPLKLSEESILSNAEFRGEVYMPREAFEEMNAKRLKKGKEPFANPRNAAAGTVRTKDPKVVAKRPLNIFIYSMSYYEEGDFSTHEETIEEMKKAGLRINKYVVKRGIDDVYKYLQEFEEQKDALNYEIDGMVIKVNDLEAHKILGHTTHHPRWAIAYKYPPTRKTTEIKDIRISVGRTGKLTPIAILNPIELSGTTVGRASLHNEDEIERKDIRIGDVALIQKAGEIIPQVVKVIKNKRDGSEERFQMPHTCPVCGSKAKRFGDEVARRCVNAQCPAQVKQRIEHWGERGAMNIKGLGPKLLDRLVDNGVVKNIAEIYKLSEDDLADIERMGHKSAQNLLEEIENSKSMGLSKVLYGLGITYVGDHVARVLTKKYNSIDDLKDANKKELEEVEEIGPKIAESVVSFFEEEKNRDLIEELRSNGVKMVTEKEKKRQFLKGKKFVFTGALETYTRAEASEKVREVGGRVTSSVSGETDYLVVGEDPGSKLAKAKREGTQILDEEQFLNMLKTHKLP